MRVDELCSDKDDLYLSFYDKCSGYFSSNRSPSIYLDEENCCNDIFSFKYPTPKEKTTIYLDTIKTSSNISIFSNDEPNQAKTLLTLNIKSVISHIIY